MFTGLVSHIGEVASLNKQGKEAHLFIRPLSSMQNIEIGESIAVNGVCLTVESCSATNASSKANSGTFTAYASAETLSISNLKFLSIGSRVNLERALRLGDRLGGHIVSGHVDCLATLTSIRREGSSTIFRISFPSHFAPEVLAKGSVALDGISLTINNCGADFLEVNVIPETQASTTVQGWKAGSQINVETDVLGKYVRNMLRYSQNTANIAASPPASENASVNDSGITMDFLLKNGF